MVPSSPTRPHSVMTLAFRWWCVRVPLSCRAHRVAASVRAGVDRYMPLPRRSSFLAVLVIYVLPVAAAAWFLTSRGLAVLALAPLSVEVVVALTVLAARKPDQQARPEPSRRPWLVPLLMVGALGAFVGIAVLA